MVREKKGTGLKYIAVSDFNLIPEYLIEQVKDREFEVSDLYKYNDLITSSPFNVLGVFVDKENMVKGFMWGSLNPLYKKVMVHILSIDSEYHGRGVVTEAGNILKKMMSKYGLKKITFSTTNPELFEKCGAKRSDRVLMEGF